MSICPKIQSNLEYTENRYGCEVRSVVHRTVLQINPDQLKCIRLMDGINDLETLEEAFESDNDMAYPHLLKLLHALWDRGMLDNEEEIQKSLFPSDTQQTLKLAQTQRKLKWLLTGFWTIKSTKPPYFHWLKSVLDSGPMALSLGFCTVLSVYVMALPEPTTVRWLMYLPLVYVYTCLLLSLNQFLTACTLAEDGQSLRLGLRNISGFFCFDFSESHLFTKPKTYAPLNISLGLACISFLGVLFTQRYSIWMATEIFLLITLCPFLPTTGAYTLEQLINIPKQRYKIGKFFTAHLGQTLFKKATVKHEWRYTVTSCVWILWFYAAIHTVGIWLRNHHIGLMNAAYDGSVGAAFVMGLFVISMAMIAYIAFVPLRILLQTLSRLVPKAKAKSDVPFGTVSTAIESDIVDVFERSLLSELVDSSFLELARFRSYNAEQWIYPNEDPGIMLVISGQIQRQHYTVEGHYQALGFADVGWVIGLSDDTDASLCIKPVELLYWPPSARSALRQQNHDNSRQFLKSFSAFARLSVDQIDALIHQAKWCEYTVGDTVLQQGTASDKLILLQTGRYQVIRDAQEIAVLEGYTIVGEAGILSGKTRNATVQCELAGRGLEIPAALLFRLLEESISARRELGGLISKREVVQ